LRIVPLIRRFGSSTASGRFGAFLIRRLANGFGLFSDVAQDFLGIVVGVTVANPINDGKRLLAFRFELGGYELPST